MIRVATRASPLALAQSGQLAALVSRELGEETELVPITTTGDRIRDRPLAAIGGKGLFIKEIEEALLDGRADLAVHSAKDLPAEIAAGLVLAAFPERADSRDALIGRRAGATLAALPNGARVGTGSVRRSSQLLAGRPDLEIVPIRGNVDTRLRKLEEESLHAVILACAGLERLGRADRIHERVDTGALLPAVGQGTLALQVRDGDPLGARLAAVDHPDTRAAITAERAFLARLEGDCSVPIAALGEIAGDGRLSLRGLVASLDGQSVARAEVSGSPDRASQLGGQLAQAVLDDGGREILAALAGAAG